LQAFASGAGHRCTAAASPAKKNNGKERNGDQQYGKEKAGYGAEGEKRERRRRGRPPRSPKGKAFFAVDVTHCFAEKPQGIPVDKCIKGAICAL
ncbi:hypothetical protein, partial [Klebsiella aerogenes]